MSVFATAFTVPSPPPATTIGLFSFTARRASSEISAPLDARWMRAGVPVSANMRESFSHSSGPGWQPELRLRMQLKPEDGTWFHCFQSAELDLCTMRLSAGIGSSEEKSNTHVTHRTGAPEPPIYAKIGRAWITGNKSGPPTFSFLYTTKDKPRTDLKIGNHTGKNAARPEGRALHQKEEPKTHPSHKAQRMGHPALYGGAGRDTLVAEPEP